MIKKFWAERLERDVKDLKKSPWNILSLIVFKYGYNDIIQTRGMGAVDIAIQIIKKKDLWEDLNEDEQKYISGLLGSGVPE